MKMDAMLLVCGAILLAQRSSGAATDSGPALPELATNPQTNSPARPSNPEQLKHDIRIIVDTNAPGVEAKPQKLSRLEVSWRGWDGLHLELHERTPLPNPGELLGGWLNRTNAPQLLQFDQVQMAARVGARVELDGAAFATTGNLAGFEPGIQLRRLLFSAGGDCILVFPVSYFIQLGYLPGGFYLNQAYLASPNIDYIGNLTFGVYGPPMCLDLVTSSRDITLMEPPAPLQAMGPPNMLGLQIGHPIFDGRATWAFGIFGDAGEANQYGNASHNYGSAIGRLTWLAIDHLDSQHPASNRLLHLGLSTDLQYSVTSSVRYQSRPESYIAPYVIDTGNIDASSAGTFDAEAAWVNGPFSVQGEFIHSFVAENTGSLLNFGGFYGQVSWYLTGESRPYDPTVGDFKRLVPRRNFNFGKNGAWGAWEVAARFSHTDLDSAQVHGGKLNLLMAGLNWYLNSHVRWMFNYGMGHVSGGTYDGDMFVFQTRVGVDF